MREREKERKKEKRNMSVLFRARVASFLSGVAVAGVFGVVQLRKDLEESKDALISQVEQASKDLEKRVQRLEMLAATSPEMSKDAAS